MIKTVEEKNRLTQNEVKNAVELLNFLSSHYNINMCSVQSEYDMEKKNKYLKMHPGKVWQGKDGRWFTHFGERKERKLIVRNTKAEMEAFIIEYYKTLCETPTFDMIYRMWDKRRRDREELRPQSFDRYENAYKRYFTNNVHAKKLLSTKVNQISEDDLDDFIYPSIKAYNMSNKDFSTICSFIRGAMKFAVQKRYTDFNVVNYLACLDKPRNAFKKTKKTPEEQTFSVEETNRLMEYFLENGDVWSLGLIVLAESGLRVGELAALKKTDVDGDVLFVQRTETHYKDETTHKNVITVQDFPKTESGNRQVVVGEVAAEVLAELLKMNPECEWLFSDEGKRICEAGFRKKLYRTCDALNIKRRSPHKLRKTYATQLIYSGVNEEVVKNQMGHADISTTRRSYVYARQDLDYVRAQLAKTKMVI